MMWSLGNVRATMVHPGMRSSSILNTLDVLTCRHRVAKLTQHIRAKQGWDMLCLNVADFWPELANAEPTMLRYVA